MNPNRQKPIQLILALALVASDCVLKDGHKQVDINTNVGGNAQSGHAESSAPGWGTRGWGVVEATDTNR